MSSSPHQISPDDVVWRTPLLHPPKSDVGTASSSMFSPSATSASDPQVSARCLEMAGGSALDFRVIVSERSYPDGKHEVRIRNPKLSSAISRPLVPPIAFEASSASTSTSTSSAVASPVSGSGTPRVHFHAACLSLCVIPDRQSPQQKTALWCGWSSGHISVHLVGGRSAGEVVECFVAHRGGGPVRMLKSMSCEMATSSPYTSISGNNSNSNNNSNTFIGSESVLSRLVASASSDFAITLWDSQSMKPLKSIQLGAAIGMVRSILLDRFALYSHDVTASPVLVRQSLCIVGADNGCLIPVDCKKEILVSTQQQQEESLGSSTSATTRSNIHHNTCRNFSNVVLVNQRTAVTSLAVLHFPDSPSVCLSGSDGGVVRAQALAAQVNKNYNSNIHNNNNNNNSTSPSSATTAASSTVSLQHGAIHCIAMLPTSSLPLAVGRGGAHGGANLVLASCASGRIFILLVGASGCSGTDNDDNSSSSISSRDIAPLLSAIASFVSPTGPVVQLCSRPGWSRAVYAVTSTGGVDLYASSEAVLNRIEISETRDHFDENDDDVNNHHHRPSLILRSHQQPLPPSHLKAKSVSLILQAERRYEQKMQLLLDLAVESKRHCEDRDGAVVRLKDENEQKSRILEAMTKQCETLTLRVEQLRIDNTRLENERGVLAEHARVATGSERAAKRDADGLVLELQSATERESNTAALMDQLRTRVISLEKQLDQSMWAARRLEKEMDLERTRSLELENTLGAMRNDQVSHRGYGGGSGAFVGVRANTNQSESGEGVLSPAPSSSNRNTNVIPPPGPSSSSSSSAASMQHVDDDDTHQQRQLLEDLLEAREQHFHSHVNDSNNKLL